MAWDGAWRGPIAPMGRSLPSVSRHRPARRPAMPWTPPFPYCIPRILVKETVIFPVFGPKTDLPAPPQHPPARAIHPPGSSRDPPANAARRPQPRKLQNDSRETMPLGGHPARTSIARQRDGAPPWHAPFPSVRSGRKQWPLNGCREAAAGRTGCQCR